MRKSYLILGASILFGGAQGASQSPSAAFNEFRRQILSDYDAFKSRILEHYADFLDGEWHEFEPLWEEESPYTEPKPKSLPQKPPEPEPAPAPTVAKLPTPHFGPSTPGGLLAATPGGALREGSIREYDIPSIKIDVPNMGGSSRPSTSAPLPDPSAFINADLAGKSNYELAALRLPDPGFAFGSFPGQIAAPSPGESGIVNIDMPPRDDNFVFEFYGMPAFIPKVDFSIASVIKGPEETGAHWKKMADQEGGLETSRQLFGLAQELGLNGYLTYRLAEAYVNQKFKDSNPAARMSAIHFLLSNMGYDARLLRLDDTFMVMMPFDQEKIYSTLSQTIDGRKYTILYPEGFKAPQSGQQLRVLTCNLPQGSHGKTSDLRLTGLNLPMKAKEFNLTDGNLTLKGEVNENIRSILYHYPQMPMGDFASSWVDSELRENLVGQLKEQLAGKSGRDAVNSLLTLCHAGFDYSTDQDFHGFEKPYFLEENFIYDKNDCEDRAIFFSYMLWNVLGLPCQLVQYPGHESATVAIPEDITGYYYDTDGAKYYSADPTYIGSHVGMVMKPFRNVSPTVDKHYR